MNSRTGRLRVGRARAEVLLFALISAVLFVLLVSNGQLATAQTTPQVDPWAWGRNDQGQLGNGTTNVTANPNPVQVSNLTDVLTVAAGNQYSLAIKSDGIDDGPANNGTVWAWGSDGTGQLGDGGTNTNQNTPVQASGLTDVVDVAAGLNHSLAVKSDGAVYAWGSNSKGQLGYDPDPTTTNLENSGTPGQVSGLADVVAVAGGTFYSLALKSDGTLWAWGNNDIGQLGNGESGSGNMSITPVQVEDPSDPTGFLTDVVDVAAGSNHSLAIKSDGIDDGPANDGTVWAWGFNSQGMLGYDPDPTTSTTFEPSSTPGQVSGLTDATEVSGGNFHSVALKSNGTVWTWGANSAGQLGHDPDPTTPGLENTVTPGQVKDQKNPIDPSDDVPLTDVEDVAGGLNHNLAVTSTHGAVWTWGCNDYGQLGNSGVSTSPGSNCAFPNYSVKPVQAIRLFGATDVAGGGGHSLALADNDNMAPSTTNMLSPAPNANGWNDSDVTVDLNATDTGGSDVGEITYSATGAQAISSTTVPGDSATFNINTEGETTIAYSAKDHAGNTETPQNTLTVKLDKAAPETAIDDSSPSGPINNNKPTFNFDGTDNLTAGGDLRFFYQVDDSGSWTEASGTSVTLGGTEGLTDAEHTFSVKAVDQADNEDAIPAERTFTVDTAAPRVTSTMPDKRDTEVKRNTSLTATFLEKMNRATLTKSTFKLFKVNADGTMTQIVNVAVTPSLNGLKAILDPYPSDPSRLLAKNTRYKAVVTTGARDPAGNRLDQDSTRTGSQTKVWTFTTGSSG